MATVREAFDAYWVHPSLVRWVCGRLNIPPDTENTPHAIAAAVLGMEEETLRRDLLIAQRVHEMKSAVDARGATARGSTGWRVRTKLVNWLTRPEQTDGGEG